ncbi:hypothetical protein ACFFX0_07225 [Citricoccus parietis]|uniref:Uncharacterized protein n=1 Tax=Citricoccus parietis TaxID=592307 RepID=A0ABV5FWC9_9MICC
MPSPPRPIPPRRPLGRGPGRFRRRRRRARPGRPGSRHPGPRSGAGSGRCGSRWRWAAHRRGRRRRGARPAPRSTVRHLSGTGPPGRVRRGRRPTTGPRPGGPRGPRGNVHLRAATARRTASAGR